MTVTVNEPQPRDQDGALKPDPRRFMSIRVDRLVVDDNYQRSVDSARLEKLINLANSWDWAKAEAITVVPIGGGLFRVTEGQGRVLALQMRDAKAKLPCMVLPADYMGVASEAEVALGIATSRNPHTALQRWRLRFNKGDAYVMMATTTLKGYNLRVGEHGGPYTIAAVSSLIAIIERGSQTAEEGAELLDLTLKTLTNAWPPKDPSDATTRFDSMVLRVISTVIYRNPNIVLDRLVKVLSDKSVRRWLNDADGKRSKFNLMGEQIVAAYNYKRRGQKAVWVRPDAADQLGSLVHDDEDDEDDGEDS